ncbi:flagellar biosynthesis regulator FlaF [Histidinibacterium aquaticum]|uniref:FlaF protein n=1 Tax=Histidinibacterium aquaticum TaxID=2613962 RepID=A0A5J5GQC8_9RHOB|nr:flagellar biosynthesis regulator FlaF [Histidinibacterium aquaticum]KAA9009963.1 flaF protein [Histidinibacterium aquaticum]
MSIAAYKRTISESETPRQIERRVLSQVTIRLEEKAESYDAAEASSDRIGILADGLREALTENLTIWHHLRYDLASPENALPASLRAQLISLSLWIERQTNAILGGGAGLRSLAAVNRSIVDGLAGRAPGPMG